MIRGVTLMAVAWLGLAGLGCSGSNPTGPAIDPFQVRQLPEAIRADASGVVDGNNRFALDLYARLRSRDGNLFCSPFSISTAFAMVHGGARGQTETEMAQVFHFPEDQAKLHPVYQALLASLNTGIGLEGYRLDLANRLWGQSGYSFLPEYLALTRERYGAELKTVDFMADPEAARREVNQWVEQITQQRIKDLMPEGSINGDTRLVLANAIYFKGKWQLQFDPEKTKNLPFHLSPGNEVTVPTMSMKAELATASVDGVQLLDLPYKGRDVSMLILLPAAIDGLPALEARLTTENLAAWVQALHKREIDVYLPRFEMTSEFALNSTLAEMGMPTAFSDRADLSGMNGLGGLFIQSAQHKAFVKVNEEGTEAAAATGIGVGVVSVPPVFQADHPFLFLIRDNVTGSILFLGRVANPLG